MKRSCNWTEHAAGICRHSDVTMAAVHPKNYKSYLQKPRLKEKMVNSDRMAAGCIRSVGSERARRVNTLTCSPRRDYNRERKEIKSQDVLHREPSRFDTAGQSEL
jgi:hypothetical protein